MFDLTPHPHARMLAARTGTDASQWYGPYPVPLSFLPQARMGKERPGAESFKGMKTLRMMPVLILAAMPPLAIDHVWFLQRDDEAGTGHTLRMLTLVDRYSAYDIASGMTIVEMVPDLADLIARIREPDQEKAGARFTKCFSFLPELEQLRTIEFNSMARMRMSYSEMVQNGEKLF